jgi:ferredoxin-NADP reductase
VSIKRVVPHGIASNFVHDQVQRGALLDVRAPAGHFFLDLDSTAPVVLLAGGVGITPLLAMIEAVVQGGTPREVWLFYGVRQPAELMQRPRFEALAREHDWLHLQLCYSDHRPEGTGGVVGEHHGRVGVDLLQRLLPANNYEFYICGPPPMMQSLTAGLREWGVPDERVHFEAFGPASVKTATPPPQVATASAGGVEVQFARSGKVVNWTAASGSLLELAESVGVPIDAGCRAGNCGSCVVPLRSGAVDYPTSPGFPNEPGTCLSCVARPRGSVVLEA